MDNWPLLFLLLIISEIATVMIWRKILKKTENIWFKLLCLVISAIPIFGPIFYLLIDPPPKLPLSKQEKQIPKGTEVYSSFKPLIDAIQKILK